MLAVIFWIVMTGMILWLIERLLSPYMDSAVILVLRVFVVACLCFWLLGLFLGGRDLPPVPTIPKLSSPAAGFQRPAAQPCTFAGAYGGRTLATP